MDRIKIGWSRRDISLDKPVSIPGQMYIRVSEGIHDPIYVTALCVDGGENQDKVIFLSCDVVTQYWNILKPLQEKVRLLRPDIPENALVWNFTHTHSSIDLGNPPEKTPDGVEIYSGAKTREFFIEQATEAIIEAWDSREEGGMAYGYGYAVVAHSRRVVYFKEEKMATNKRTYMTPSGYAVMYGKTNDPLFSHYEAGADHFLNLMFTFDRNEKLTGIVVNVPCPSQCSGGFTKLSADYWNEVRELIAKEYGDHVYILPQCAPAGDLSPRTLHYNDAQARRMLLKYNLQYDPGKSGPDYYNRSMAERYDIAERIVDGIRDVYGWAKKEIFTHIPVRHVYEIMSLERRKITEAEKQWCEENLELLKAEEPRAEDMTPEEFRIAMSRHNSAVRRNKGGIERYEDVKKNPTLDMPAHIVQIGDIAFATVRFELYMDFMHRLQARSPFIQTFAVQLAGSEGGNYLATQRAADAIGYSASMFCNMVSADGGQQWVENVLKVLNDMKENA